jgi:hypothetical protein
LPQQCPTGRLRGRRQERTMIGGQVDGHRWYVAANCPGKESQGHWTGGLLPRASRAAPSTPGAAAGAVRERLPDRAFGSPRRPGWRGSAGKSIPGPDRGPSACPWLGWWSGSPNMPAGLCSAGLGCRKRCRSAVCASERGHSEDTRSMLRRFGRDLPVGQELWRPSVNRRTYRRGSIQHKRCHMRNNRFLDRSCARPAARPCGRHRNRAKARV